MFAARFRRIPALGIPSAGPLVAAILATLAVPVSPGASTQFQVEPAAARVGNAEASASAITYTVVDLGSLGGGVTIPTALSENGIVVGSSSDAAFMTHAFLWEHGVMVDLGTLKGAAWSGASAVNKHGEVVGWYKEFLPHGGEHNDALYWNQGSMQTVDSLVAGSGWNVIEVWDINDSGQLVGVGLHGGLHAFIASDGSVVDIGTLGGCCSEARGVNRHGAVVGRSEIPISGEAHAFLYLAGTLLDLGVLPGDLVSVAEDVNDSNIVVGDSGPGAPGSVRGFIWRNGVMASLGTLAGNSHALAVNNCSEVVGYYEGPDGHHAFIWRSGVLIDLNSLIQPGTGLKIGTAVDINDRGFIAAIAFDYFTNPVGVLLLPNPPTECH